MAPEQLQHERAALGRGRSAELDEHDAVALHLLEATHCRAFELAREPREERADRTVVFEHPPVLQMEARGVGVGRHAQAQDAVGRVARLEHEQEVARRQPLYVDDRRPGNERGELAYELAHVVCLESLDARPWAGVYASSSSTL